MTRLTRIFVSLAFLAGLNFGLETVNANPAIHTTGKISQVDVLLAKQGKRERQKTDEEIFKEMCEFLELDEQQTEKAGELFDDRLKEIKEIFGSAGSGKLSQQEAMRKNAESYKKYREMFENLLTEEQKAKLKIWEEQRLTQGRRG